MFFNCSTTSWVLRVRLMPEPLSSSFGWWSRGAMMVAYHCATTVGLYNNIGALRHLFCIAALHTKTKKYYQLSIWVFPKIGAPPNHPFLIGFSIINHPFWGYHYFLETPIRVQIWTALIDDARVAIQFQSRFDFDWRFVVGFILTSNFTFICVCTSY